MALPRARSPLVCGPAGCGKTLLAMEFLVHGITQLGEPGVFVAFEESADDLRANVASLGFDLARHEAEGRLVLDQVSVAEGEVEDSGEWDLEGLVLRIGAAIDAVGAKRVVIDTIETLFGAFTNTSILRAQLRRLFRWLKDRDVTAVITGERGDGTLTRHGIEEYVSDCVIVLDHRVIDQTSTRRLRVLKYHGDGVAVPVLVGVSHLAVDDDHLTCLTFTDLTVQNAQDRQIALLSEQQAQRVSDLQDAQAALVRQATHDALTGLPNRVLLVDRIDQALSLAKRSGLFTAILFIDLDRFKHVNDTHGHAVGDRVLRSVAEELVAILRPMDTVARLGGDEFVVLATEVDSHLHAVDIGTRIVAELSSRKEGSPVPEQVVGSIGIAVSVGGRGPAEVLLGEADTAIYHAKSRGGGRVELFDEAIGRQVQARSTARLLLQSALDDGRVTVHYQPIVDLTSGCVEGFEALAKIGQTDGSVLPTAAFIPVAEESGLIVPLGTRVLDLACIEAEGWQHAALGGRPLTVAVNLSARQFERGDLPALVRATLEESGLAPHRLHLEITETATIDLDPALLEQLGSIRDLGGRSASTTSAPATPRSPTCAACPSRS